MRRAMTWWRNLGGLMAACVLALLVVAPTASMASCVCNDGGAVVRVETSTSTVEAVQSDRQDQGAPCDAACCVGGHCHHGGVVLDAPVAMAPAPAPTVAAHAMTSTHALASRPISGPERPPRA
jgi:hypothetical protein